MQKIIKEELAATYLTEQGIFDQPGTKKPEEDKAAEEEGEEKDPKEDVDYQLADAGIKLPSALQKAMEPKNAMDFAKKDEMIDAADNPKHQAAMLAKFALDYADGDEGTAQKILKMATQQGLKTLTKGMEDEEKEGAEKKEKKNEGITGPRMRRIVKEEIARYILQNQK